MIPKLYVNVDHVATLRQQRGTSYPDPVIAAALCELAGAEGITVHLREDRRHIQERDVRVLRQTVRGVFNLEMAATAQMVALALDIQPHVCTLVPEKRAERTTEGGLDVGGRGGGAGALSALEQAVKGLRDGGIGVSLFVDPDPEAIVASQRLGAHTVELHTGYFCDAPPRSEAAALQLARLQLAARSAAELKIRLAAGHGLDFLNVGPVAGLPLLEELNIGHGLVARAVMLGMERAVAELRAAIAAGAMSATAISSPSSSSSSSPSPPPGSAAASASTTAMPARSSGSSGAPR